MPKPLKKSKTFWASVVSIVTGIGFCANKNYGEGLPMIFIGITQIFQRMAK